MRGLGRFVGHIWGAVSSAPTEEGQAHEVRRTHEQENRDGVILRRTTIEEIEIPPGAQDERAKENDA